MIRGDLLQAKRAQVAGKYQEEVVSLGRTRARDGHARQKVREREERFWRAIAHASISTNAPPAGGHAMALSRAMQAHHDLSKANAEHRKVSGEVQHQIARVIKVKCVLSTVDKVRSRERMVRAHQLAEWQGEEVLEVSLSRRASVTHRREQRSIHYSLSEEKGGREMLIKDTPPPVDPHANVTPRFSEAHLNAAIETCGVRPEASPVSLQGVQSEEGRFGAALRMRMEKAGAPLSCRLETTAAGRVGVVMEAANPSLVRTLERERYGIMRRLSENGIAVGGFEVRRDLTMRGALSGFLRRSRQAREEDDDNLIA